MPSISSDEILMRQRTLRARGGSKDEGSGPSKDAGEDLLAFKISSLTRLRKVIPSGDEVKSPEVVGKSPEVSSKTPEVATPEVVSETAEVEETQEEKESGQEERLRGSGAGEANPQERRTSSSSNEGAWHVRENVSSTPPASPRTSVSHKVPPAVKPKPKSSKPVAPDRRESDDLIASLHAAQAALSHRPPGPGGAEANESSAGELRRSRTSVGDNTFL